MSPGRSLGAQALILAIGLGVAQLMVAVLHVITARELGPAEYGPVAVAIALGMVGGGLADMGATEYWVREVASGRMAKELLDARTATRMYIVAAISVLILILTAFFAPQFVAAGAILFSHSVATTVLVPLRAERKADYVGCLMIAGRGIAIISFFILLAVGVNAGISLWVSIVFGDLVRTIITYPATPPAVRINLRSRSLRNPWAGARWYLMIYLSSSARLLDLPLVGFFAGPSAAGVYGAVNRWTQPLVLATSAFSSAAAPFIARETNLRNLRGPVLRAIPMLMVPLVLCVWLLFGADWLVGLVLGAEFSSSAIVLKWLAGAMILSIAAQPMLAALLARRFDHLTAVISVVSTGVQLALVAILAPNFGALGAGIAFFAYQALQLSGVLLCVVIILGRRRMSIFSYLRN